MGAEPMSGGLPSDERPSGEPKSGNFFEQVYAVVEVIPRGRVTTYGRVAWLVKGRPGAARTVGWALNALAPERSEQVPWWRVINAQGRISLGRDAQSADEQRSRLESEGLRFGRDDRIDLGRCGWP